MKCTDVRAQIAHYLDDELAEAQAAPLRAHLLECPGCRAELQEAKSLSAWFVAPEPVPIPSGFAARVAHRAQRGDRGALIALPTPAAGPAALEASAERDPLRGFVLSAVAVAALVLLALSIALRRLELPDGRGLQAEDASRETAIEALHELNAGEEAER